MDIRVIGIAGAGTMGSSMAETFAKFGYKVVLYDLFPEQLDKARHLISLNQKTEVSEGIVTAEESEKLIGLISYESDMNCFSGVDVLIEAIKEDMGVKQDFWAKASAIVPEHTLLASNTSGLSITKIGSVTLRPERFCGMHWINPPHLIPLIEVIMGEQSSESAAKAIYDLSEGVGKKPVIIKDAPGFALNRIQFAIMRECLYMVDEGIASLEDVDKVMKYGLGMRYACLGPFEVADFGGLDVFYNISSYLFADLCDKKEVFSLLKEHYENNELGVKNGKGFYDYSGDKADRAIINRDEMYTKIAKCLFGEGK